jgi:hypothetical protein
MYAVVGIDVVVIFVLIKVVSKVVELQLTRDFPSCGGMTLTQAEM